MKISVSGKGGSGKSTVVTLLALAAREKGRRTLVVDSDESNSGLYRMLGFEEPPSPLMDLLGGKKALKQRLGGSLLAQMALPLDAIPREHVLQRDGLLLMSVGKVLQAFEGCACPMGVLSREFLRKLVLSPGDLAIIDMEAGVEHFGRGIDEAIDRVLLIVEPSFESLNVGKRIHALSLGMNKKAWAVLNKIGSEKTAARLREDLEAAGIPVLGAIPQDPAVFEACLEGHPLGRGEAFRAAGAVIDALLAVH